LHWDRLLRDRAELPIRTERAARAVLPDGTPVMDALRQACRKAGGARLTEIRKATGLTGKGASDRLDKLIAAGCVSRTENPPRYYLKGQR
jgi:DNA-binding IclR family transcriptional regulator